MVGRVVQCRYRFSISSHCYSGQVLACQAAVLCVCACVCVRASPLCPSMFSLLRGLRSVQLILPGKKVPWEEKDGVGARVSTEVFFFFLSSKDIRFLAACQRLGMQWYSSRQQGQRQVKPSCVLNFCFCDPRSQRGTFKLVQITREMWSISGSAAAIHWNTDKFATNILTLSRLLAWSFNGTNLANPPNIHARTRLNPKIVSECIYFVAAYLPPPPHYHAVQRVVSSQGQRWDGMESERAGISGNDTELAATPSGISDKSLLRPELLSPSFSPLPVTRKHTRAVRTRMLELAQRWAHVLTWTRFALPDTFPL